MQTTSSFWLPLPLSLIAAALWRLLVARWIGGATWEFVVSGGVFLIVARVALVIPVHVAFVTTRRMRERDLDGRSHQMPT